MKFYFTFLHFILYVSFAKANYINYYNFINEAEFQMYSGNYELAISNFKLGFTQINQPKARDLYFTARCLGQVKKEEEMYEYLSQALSNGLKKDQLTIDSLWFTDYRFSDEFTQLINKNYLPSSSTDSSFIIEIEQIWTRLNKIKSNKYTQDSVQIIFLKEENKEKEILEIKHDFFNLFLTNEIPNLFIKTNLIDKALDKESTLESVIFHLFFQFFRDNTKDAPKILNKLQKGLIEGLIPPVLYAKIIDFYLLFSGKQIKYGSEYNSIDISNLPAIIENRTKIGLSIYYAASPNYNEINLDYDISFNYKH